MYIIILQIYTQINFKLFALFIYDFYLIVKLCFIIIKELKHPNTLLQILCF